MEEIGEAPNNSDAVCMSCDGGHFIEDTKEKMLQGRKNMIAFLQIFFIYIWYIFLIVNIIFFYLWRLFHTPRFGSGGTLTTLHIFFEL